MAPSRRAGRWLRLAFWPVVALSCVGIVGQASYAAFSAKVSNSGNTFGVGTVSLSDDDSGAALFSLTGLKPGSNGSRCITVTSTGSLPSSVKLYTANTGTTNNLSSYITLTVTQGTGGSFGACSGFTALGSGSAVYSGTLASLFSSATSYGSGVGTWTPSGGSNANESRTYQFAYAVSSSTPDSAQGGTATFTLTWETQNT